MDNMKTLKDIKFIRFGKGETLIPINQLKQEVIKWVKEDLENLKKENGDAYYASENLIEEWMERLNIEESDLK